MGFPKPEVGQKVFVATCVNDGVTGTVNSVGRKYFKIKYSGMQYEMQFHIDNWLESTQYGGAIQAYPNKQMHLDKLECKKWSGTITDALLYGERNFGPKFPKITVEQYRAAGKALGLSLDEMV